MTGSKIRTIRGFPLYDFLVISLLEKWFLIERSLSSPYEMVRLLFNNDKRLFSEHIRNDDGSLKIVNITDGSGKKYMQPPTVVAIKKDFQRKKSNATLDHNGQYFKKKRNFLHDLKISGETL